MCQAREQVREGTGVSGFDDKAAFVPRNQRCEFPSAGGDDDHGPGHRGNAVELARNDEPFEFGLERYPVQVRHPERVVQRRLVLVGEEPKVPIEMKLFGAWAASG